MHHRKEKATKKFSCVKERKTADNVSFLKRGNIADKVSCIKNIYNRKIRLLAMCHASNSKFYLI